MEIMLSCKVIFKWKLQRGARIPVFFEVQILNFKVKLCRSIQTVPVLPGVDSRHHYDAEP